MSSLRVTVTFKDFQGLDEKSSQRIRDIIEKNRKNVNVKKIGEGKGCNTIGLGEKIPDLLADIDFELEYNKTEDLEKCFSKILKEIEAVGYEFTYEFHPMSIIFYDGGINEEFLVNTITKKRPLGYGEFDTLLVNVKDMNTKDIMMRIFYLVCESKNFIELLIEILNDFEGYIFEVRGH